MFMRASRIVSVVGGMLIAVTANPGFTDESSLQQRGSQPQRFPPKLLPADCWTIHSLGTLGGPFSYAKDLNNAGQVTGNAATEPRILDSADPPWTLVRPFISAPNGGALTEIITPGYLFGTATAMNEAGQVVGDTTIGRSFPIAYVTDPGGGNVRLTLAWTYVRDINDAGQTLWDIWYPYFRVVVGSNDQPNMDGTDLIDVEVPNFDPYRDFMTAVALNDAGQVAVNTALHPGGTALNAYRWSSYEGAIALAPNAAGSRAVQMNDAGQIVGIITVKGIENGQPAIEQAFVTRRYSPTALVMLGAPGDGTQPTDINNWSQIVGTMNVNGQRHGYVTPPLNVYRSIDLDQLDEVTRNGWSNLRPAAINDRGQIAGTGTHNGATLAFLLTPQSLLAYLPARNGKQPKCYRV